MSKRTYIYLNSLIQLNISNIIKNYSKSSVPAFMLRIFYFYFILYFQHIHIYIYIIFNILCCFSIKIVATFYLSLQEFVHGDEYNIDSQTSVPRTRMGRIPWMVRTDLKVPSIFLIFLSKKKQLSLEHRYLEQSNSINGPVNNKITSFTMPNLNIAI